jgi:transposase InsO family protein
MYVVRHKLDVKTVFQTIYNLVETQFSAIKKLKTDNGGEYVNNKMSVCLAIQGIIHDLSPPYAYESNGLPKRMNRTDVTMDQLMTLDYSDMIRQALWAKADSTAVHIKSRLPHSAFKLKKLP